MLFKDGQAGRDASRRAAQEPAQGLDRRRASDRRPERHGPAAAARLSANGSAERLRRCRKARVWQYEPKWDGFRCLLFVTARRRLRSKSGQTLGRYFPDLLACFGIAAQSVSFWMARSSFRSGGSFVRGIAAAAASGRKPRSEARRGSSRAILRFRPAGGRQRTGPHRLAARRAPSGVGKVHARERG